MILFMLSACKKKEREQAMINEALQLKTELYRKEAMKKCKKEMLVEADILADSILLMRINVRNPIEKPPRPGRPEAPEVNFRDTLELLKLGKNKKKNRLSQDSLTQGSSLRKTE